MGFEEQKRGILKNEDNSERSAKRETKITTENF